MLCHTPHATRHTPHATRHTPHTTHHTPHTTHHKSQTTPSVLSVGFTYPKHNLDVAQCDRPLI
ncbi:hypothetical protein C6B42_12530 [Aeromonas caviae]|nr:hypothetical protein C6B42_12530 [Aeromonas caviae]